MSVTVLTQALKMFAVLLVVQFPTTHQFFGPHVVQDPLRVLTVMTALHDGQKQLGGVILLNRDQVSEFCVHHDKPSFQLRQAGDVTQTTPESELELRKLHSCYDYCRNILQLSLK